MAPRKLEGVAAIASPDAHALFDKLLALAPMLGQLGITADGKLHDLPQSSCRCRSPSPLASATS